MIDIKTIKKFDGKSVGHFRFKQFDKDNYLITNEVGNYSFLSNAQFKKFITGKLNKKEKLYKDLVKKLFIKDENYQPQLIEKFKDKNQFLWSGPSLHIVVVTLRCNHRCIYCHASAGNPKAKGLDMDLATAKKVVELIFKTNNHNIAIELQGGEPLLNWEVLKFIVTFANEKNKLEKKNLLISLVSNFSLLDDKKIKFLMDQGVEFCTSLDGDEATHNYNRIYAQGNSYKDTVSNIKKINNLYKKKLNKGKKEHFKVGAVLTVSRKTLDKYKEVVDTYIDLGFRMIYLRYLNPYGFAVSSKQKIWYTPQEYIDFYTKALDYILEKNYQGRFFADFTAVTYLAKILFNKDINNLDLRSPCGAGIGQLAYNYNGDIYTCDEGRMMARMGDDMFKLGNINEDNFEKLINNDLCKSMCMASCTNGYNNIFPITKNNVKCIIDEAIIDYLFKKLKNKKNLDIFTDWLKKARPQIFNK